MYIYLCINVSFMCWGFFSPRRSPFSVLSILYLLDALSRCVHNNFDFIIVESCTGHGRTVLWKTQYPYCSLLQTSTLYSLIPLCGRVV